MLDLLARIISIIFSPPALLAWAFIFMLASSGTTRAQFINQLALFILAEAGILVFVVWLWKKKYISDVQISKREERHRLNIFACVYLAVLGSIAFLFGLQTIYTFSLLMLIGAVLFTTLTFITKVSAHMVAAGAWAVLLTHYGGLQVWVWAIVFLTGWARIKRRRHTLVQVILGAVLSLVTYVIGQRWLL